MLSKKSKSYSRAGGKVKPTWHVTFVTFNNSSVTMRPLVICNTGFILSIVYVSLVCLPFFVVDFLFNLPWRWHNLELHYIFLISGWLPHHNSFHLHQFGAIGVPVKVMRSMSHPTRQCSGRWVHHETSWQSVHDMNQSKYKWNPIANSSMYIVKLLETLIGFNNKATSGTKFQ